MITTVLSVGCAVCLVGVGGGVASASTTAGASSDPPVSASATSTASSACPAAVTIDQLQISVQAGTLMIQFSHDGQGCSAATPATLHVHQNLLTAPQAGSDAAHQMNQDISVDGAFGSIVQLPLLESADGKCFVQVDVHAGALRRGRFVPTSSCTSTVPPSSTPPTSTAPAPSSSSPVPITSSVEPTAASRPVLSRGPAGPVPSDPVVDVRQTGSAPVLAMTGADGLGPVAFGVLLLALGLILMGAAHRPRQH